MRKALLAALILMTVLACDARGAGNIRDRVVDPPTPRDPVEIIRRIAARFLRPPGIPHVPRRP